jgi:hypothetical protein
MDPDEAYRSSADGSVSAKRACEGNAQPNRRIPDRRTKTSRIVPIRTVDLLIIQYLFWKYYSDSIRVWRNVSCFPVNRGTLQGGMKKGN